MLSPVARTSRWVAASRARETESPKPLFTDPLARSLAGEDGFAFLAEAQQVRTGVSTDGPDPYLSIRTRFFDDALLRAVEAGPRQVVMLGAGMDSRAFRLPWPTGVTVFEIDREEVLGCKEEILAGLGVRPSCSRRAVEADLEGDWAAPLLAAGFEQNSQAAFLAEGLFVYLEPSAVLSLLSAIGRLARPGSWLGADLIGPELLSSPHMRGLLDLLSRLGSPWRFASADPGQLLAGLGWQATVVQPGEPEANYGRWPHPVLPRGVPGVPRSYLVTAWLP